MDVVNYGWLVAGDVRPPEGWSLLVADLLARIDDVVAVTKATVAVRQIKEKLGELRFYYRVEPQELRDQIDPLIRAARNAHEAHARSAGRSQKCETSEAGSDLSAIVIWGEWVCSTFPYAVA